MEVVNRGSVSRSLVTMVPNVHSNLCLAPTSTPAVYSPEEIIRTLGDPRSSAVVTGGTSFPIHDESSF